MDTLENDAAKQLPDTLKEATLVKFKNFNYFESLDHKKKIKANLKPGKGNKIQFYKNGKPLGVAFEEINDGVYYPAVSLFKSAKVMTFIFRPRSDVQRFFRFEQTSGQNGRNLLKMVKNLNQ